MMPLVRMLPVVPTVAAVSIRSSIQKSLAVQVEPVEPVEPQTVDRRVARRQLTRKLAPTVTAVGTEQTSARYMVRVQARAAVVVVA
jgi:hypothetical protein